MTFYPKDIRLLRVLQILEFTNEFTNVRAVCKQFTSLLQKVKNV